jgi:hypothetical protein
MIISNQASEQRLRSQLIVLHILLRIDVKEAL